MSKKIFSSCIVVIILMLFISLIISVFSCNNNENTNNTISNSYFSTSSYCAFGDSITYGYDTSSSSGRMNNPYPTVVAKTLGLKSYSNKGVNAATLVSCSGRANITEIVTSTTGKYNIISLMGGVNDYYASLPLGTTADTTNDTIYGSLDMIADYLTTNYPNAFIFFMTPYKANSNGNNCLLDNSAGYSLRDVAEAVEYVAAKYDIPVLDMFNDGQFEVVEMSSSSSDGLHPSQNFVNNYTAPQIVEFIKDNFS